MLTLAIVWFHILCYVLGFQIGPRQITEKQKDSLWIMFCFSNVFKKNPGPR